MPSFLSTAAIEYVQVQVTTKIGVGFLNPTADTVQMAFVRVGATPGPTDWQAAIWKTDTTLPFATSYWACCLVGPGGTIQLAAGSWDVWVKVVDSPEIPAILSGRLIVQ